MSKTVRVRDIIIGEGIPKVCVPVFEKTEKEILGEAEHIAGLSPDIVEFRADRFEYYDDEDKLVDVLAGLRHALGETPLLMTLRTSDEGGEADIGDEQYADIMVKACRSGLVDMVDVEALGSAVAVRIIEAARSEGVKAIASHHDFAKTPDREDIIEKFLALQETGADIVKIAVMPQSYKDVITLLDAAKETVNEKAICPVVAISMSETGVISRLAAELFGSAITFGAASKASAPGQIGTEELKEALALFHEALGSGMPCDRRDD